MRRHLRAWTVSVACLLVCVFFVCASQAQSSYTIMGQIKSHQADGYEITFNCENGKVRLSFLTDSIVRVHMAPAGKEFPPDDLHLGENGPYAVVRYWWPGTQYKISEEFNYDLEGVVYTIRTARLVVKVREQPFKLAFYDTDGNLLVMEKPGIVEAGLGFAGSKVYETMELDEDEHFFGFGGHNHPLDMRGRQIICSARELESKNETGGFAQPFFMSSRGYGIFFNNLDDDVTFKMGTTEGEYSFEATSGEMEGWDMDYYLIFGPRFEDILKRHLKIVGNPMLPAKWFFGHLQMECCNWDAEDVIDAAHRFRNGDWPCDVLIIDGQSLSGVHKAGGGFAWAESFGDYKRMFEIVKELGFKTGNSSSIGGGQRGTYDWPAYDPTVESNLSKYWARIAHKNVDGLDFWRQDNSERYPTNAGVQKFANGYESHNLFGSLWAKNVVEQMQRMGLYGRPVISRGGPVGGHRYIIPWPGDLPHGVEYLPVDLNWLRNGGLSAYPFISVDSGGYKGAKPLDEHNVIRRVINMALVVPVSKGQGAVTGGAMFPWLFTPKQQDLYRYYFKLRYRLHPYIYSSAIEAHQTGRPVLASLVFDYQDDENTYNKDYHFMFGRQILVAPVLDKVDAWKVYLPKGKWVHYWTGKEYQGGRTVAVDAPLYGKDGLPMFVKAGAIIPMIPQMNYIYEMPPETITLDVYPDADAPSSYTMYDCETVNSLIKQTLFKCREDKKEIRISAGTSDKARELWVHAAGRPAWVRIGPKKLRRFANKAAYDSAKQGWYYGAGCFYGSDTIKTINIKIAKGKKASSVRIRKRGGRNKK